MMKKIKKDSMCEKTEFSTVFYMLINGYNPQMQEEEWKELLTKEQYKILRESATEPAFSGKLCNHQELGSYCCAGCGQVLFHSSKKFDSGTGWPSFTDPVEKRALTFKLDFQLSYPRKEVKCSRCQSHLGHVFDDGPAPSYKRYCINSLSLHFTPESASISEP